MASGEESSSASGTGSEGLSVLGVVGLGEPIHMVCFFKRK